MTHGVAQLHSALVATLSGLPTTGTNVFQDESTAIPESRLPALRVLDDGVEEIEFVTQSPPRTQSRHVEFNIQVYAKSAGVKAVLNAALADIEVAVAGNRLLGGLARDVRVESVDKSYSDDADKRAGKAEIRVVVDWVCREGSPQICL